jgi:hypothetical protein
MACVKIGKNVGADTFSSPHKEIINKNLSNPAKHIIIPHQSAKVYQNTCYLDKCLYRVSVSLSQTYLVPGRKQGFRDGGEGALPELECDGSPTVHHEVELPVLPAAHGVSRVCSELGSGSVTFWYGSGCGSGSFD